MTKRKTAVGATLLPSYKDSELDSFYHSDSLG